MTAPLTSGETALPELEPPDVETPATGLTEQEVRERVARGAVNDTGERTSRTIGEIVRANIFTRFNAILGAMLVVILIIGPIQDATFGLILVANAVIGIIQELRAKRTLDQLAVLNAPRARVVRDGDVAEIAVEEVVLDDLLDLRTGDQVPCDGYVRAAVGLEVDESLLTGESDPVDKVPGDQVFSGSFVVAGSGRFQATQVGADSYARKIAAEARRFQLTRSELMEGINLILRIVTWAIIPVAALLLWSQLRDQDLDSALRATVAGVNGMVPEGLVLLTSIAFGVAAVTLARRNVLVQELPAVEGLARVDVVCLDKTGTLTEGEIVFDEVEPLGGSDVVDRAGRARGRREPQRHARSVGGGVPGARRLGPHGHGAVLVRAEVERSQLRRNRLVGHGRARDGLRRRVDARSRRVPTRSQPRAAGCSCSRRPTRRSTARPCPLGSLPRALVMFAEKIRPDAADTLAYFTEQGVVLKVISGDNPRTVAAVAKRVGLPGADTAMDARELPEDQAELAEVLEQHSVFGRVTPQQKRAMVGALQSKDHVVAMTGDGVNDALALKDADIGVAMGSGAAATRAVAQLVLLDSQFATMPGVVAEGRRVIANIERSANLFVTKTVYATLLAIAVVIAGWQYPYLPRHLTIISVFTIGIPGFFLALAPNPRRYLPGFVVRVLRFCIPAGIVAASAALVTYGIARYGNDLVIRESRTTAALVLIAVGLWVLVIQARPFNWWKTVLVGAMVGGVALILAIPALADFYAVKLPPRNVLVESAIVAGVAIVLLEVGWRLSRVVANRREVA